ncbi:5'-nucleotidase C-terminal domain-containing protein [Viscerimonas tarda]
MFKKKFLIQKQLVCVFLVAVLFSCGAKQQYAVSSLRGERIPVLTAKNPDAEMLAFVDKYKQQLDREMTQVIGRSAQNMPFGRPESLLTNLTSDVILQLDESLAGGKIDLVLMNVDGHRASMPEGDITVGNIFEIYSFDNTLVVLKLKGSDLTEVFRSYAKLGGAGISSTAKLVIKDGELVDAKVNGQPVDNEKIYTIVTLDYLAEGNDGMDALKNAVSVKDPGIILRDYMMNYVKEQTAKGKIISSKLDGRITVE